MTAAGNWSLKAARRHIRTLIVSERTDKILRLAAIEAAGSMANDELRSVLADLMDSEDDEIAEAASDAHLVSEM